MELRLLQRDLADILGVSEDCMAYWETHKSEAQINYFPAQTIGEHLRKKRIDCGLTQAELGKILKVSLDSITFWENNRSEPQIKYYPRITEFLGYDPIIFDETYFRERLRKYRYQNGASYRKMGLLLQVDASTVRAWEMGYNEPSQEKNYRIEEIVKQ